MDLKDPIKYPYLVVRDTKRESISQQFNTKQEALNYFKKYKNTADNQLEIMFKWKNNKWIGIKRN